MTSETLRDHFAAAALTGLLVHAKDGIDEETLDTPSDIAYTAYAMADAMLRERSRSGKNSSGGTDSAAKCTERDSANHDAAPAARASEATASPERVRVRGDAGTGDTPATHATRGEGSERRECTEPVAWAVMLADGERIYDVYTIEDEATAIDEAVTGNHGIVPLYRQPPCQDFSQKKLTLTDCERGAIERAVDSIASTMPYESQQGLADWKTLRGLLRRLGGGR